MTEICHFYVVKNRKICNQNGKRYNFQKINSKSSVFHIEYSYFDLNLFSVVIAVKNHHFTKIFLSEIVSPFSQDIFVDRKTSLDIDRLNLNDAFQTPYAVSTDFFDQQK